MTSEPPAEHQKKQSDVLTEADWNACSRMAPMLEFVRERASERKLRLFACGCVRQKWAQLNDRLRDAVKTAEAYADGQVQQGALWKAHYAAWGKAPSKTLHRACWVTSDAPLAAQLTA